ncbi:Fms-interacting protein-domain-containing protein [Sporodiniella umbellata]|nr:Fms-interacting protein-domain-containing protein [Sporodiniella umbellata]
MSKFDSSLLVKNVETSSKELEDILLSYMRKKIDGTLEDQYDFEEYEQVQHILDKLKDVQADSYLATRDSKEATSEAKGSLDKRQVEMQDVMYEKRHILEEIVKCHEFRSVYQDVELIPLEEFQAKASEKHSVNTDERQLMISRLEYELAIRSELKEQQEALLKLKAQLIKENIDVERKVDQFDGLLDDFVDSTAPVMAALKTEEREIELAEGKLKLDGAAVNSVQQPTEVLEDQLMADVTETTTNTAETRESEDVMDQS